MNKIRLFFAHHWQPVIAYIAGITGMYFLFGYRLASITPAASAAEIASMQDSRTIHAIINNPLLLPYKLVEYVLLKSPLDALFAARLTSVIFAVIAIWLFYRIAKAWYTPRVGLLATILFASSSWFLHAARYGTPLIMLTAVLVILWCGLLFRSYLTHRWTVLIITALVALICYIPGFLWFIVAAMVWQRKHIIEVFKALSKKLKATSLLILIVLLVPLVYGLARDPSLIKTLMGVPATIPSPKGVLTNILNIPWQILYHGPKDPATWVAGTPLIDFFGLVMLSLGLYALRFNFSLDRIRALVGLLAVSTVLIAAGTVSNLILQPLVYIAITSGIAFMLQQWFTVFPRNPLARSTAIILMAIVIALSSFYQLSHYFVAWRHAPETRNTFTQKVDL